MEVKRKALVAEKLATIVEDEKKTKKEDNSHPKVIEGLRQDKTSDDQSPKISTTSLSSSSSYVMKNQMGNYKNSIQRLGNSKNTENHHKNKTVMNLKQEKREETNVHKMRKKVWDCESTLYDSFELNSFNRQLDSAISSSARSISMPHLPPSPQPSLDPPSSTKKRSPNKISRSLQKLIKSMFRQKQSSTPFKAPHGVDMDKYYVVFDKTGSLTTIPESGESTENNSLVRKTVSERFPLSRLAGISFT